MIVDRFKDQQINALIFHKLTEDKTEQFEDVHPDLLADILEKNELYLTASEAVNTDAKSVMLTFDDGHKSDIIYAFPLLQKANARATFFIVPSFIGKAGYMTWNDVRHLHQAGMEIGSHSLTHPDFRTLNPTELQYELQESKKIIEERIGATVVSFSFPFGFVTHRAKRKANELGYMNVFGSHHGEFTRNEVGIYPRNSVNSQSSLRKVAQMMHPNLSVKVKWKVEDISKSLVKMILSEQAYFRLRRIISSIYE